jgi:hypothetical protein|uniref:Glycosyltransferase 2-like domain-containing protein n=1 Tax=viral metagenome TaxID=1070528 RepID=A0A6C0BQZ0_9ZZZZ
MLKVYYRISDKGKTINKPEYINNRLCLENFCSCFNNDVDITFVADNCNNDTIEWLKTFGKEIVRTSLGNATSCLYTLDLALSRARNDTELVYFVEADYLHRPDSLNVLMEGLERFDYVTLYDHPDKYMLRSPNPFVQHGGEVTKVYLTASTHWKETNSTTMTFAAKVSTLREDRMVFAEFCEKRNIPDDFQCFVSLTKHKNRTLVSPIPGYSTHGESMYLSPLIKWKSNMF